MKGNVNYINLTHSDAQNILNSDFYTEIRLFFQTTFVLKVRIQTFAKIRTRLEGLGLLFWPEFSHTSLNSDVLEMKRGLNVV